MGFRGPISNEIKPRFEQKAYLINFAKQIYDKKRAEYEKNRDRPAKGKVYHLIIVNYYSPSKLPVEKDLAKSSIRDYQWVSFDEGLDVVNSNISLLKTDPDSYSPDSIKFNIKSFVSHSILINYHLTFP